MTIVEIIRVAVMPHGYMPAVAAVLVIMRAFVLDVSLIHG